MRTGLCSGLVLAVIACWSVPAQANDAGKLFDRGLKDMLAGKYATGCSMIAESQALDPRPGTLFTLAECYRKAGRIASAITRYNEFLAAYEALPKNQRRAHRERAEIAQKDRVALLEVVPRLTLVLPESAPAGTVVTKDGVVYHREGLKEPLLVDPGEHVFIVQAPGVAAVEQRTTVRRGEQQRLELVVGQAETAPVTLPDSGPAGEPREPSFDEPEPDDGEPGDSAPGAGSAEESGSSQRTWGWVLAGVGMAGIAVGSVAGAVVLSERPVILDDCEGIRCGEKGLEASERANTFGLVSTVGFAVGVTGVVAGTLLLLTDGPAPAGAPTETSRRGPSRPGLLGTVVAPAGKRGAFVGVSGHF